ncbi:hypothetical protein BDR04DRAFT_1030804, partial [Suillus decipiens]
ILPAPSLDAILQLDVLDCSYMVATFDEFIDSLLDYMNPFPQKNSVIVMDNTPSLHRCARKNR